MQKVQQKKNLEVDKYLETSSPYGREAANVEIASLSMTDFPELRNTKQAYSI